MMERLLNALHKNFKGEEALRLRLLNKTPFFGNDDAYADSIMQRVYASLYSDYFVDLGNDLQEETIARTEHKSL